MDSHRRISRIIEHWSLPLHLKSSITCAGQGSSWCRRGTSERISIRLPATGMSNLRGRGMPLASAKANLDLAAEVVPQIQEAGALVAGQLSTTMHFGNHEEGLGLFGGKWARTWTGDLLGPAAVRFGSGGPAAQCGRIAQMACHRGPSLSHLPRLHEQSQVVGGPQGDGAQGDRGRSRRLQRHPPLRVPLPLPVLLRLRAPLSRLAADRGRDSGGFSGPTTWRRCPTCSRRSRAARKNWRPGCGSSSPRDPT